jgi:hypothetical protein
MHLDSAFKNAEHFLAKKDIDECFRICKQLEQCIGNNNKPTDTLHIKRLNKIKVELNTLIVRELKKGGVHIKNQSQ